MLTSFISYQLKLKLKNCRNFWPDYIFPVFLLVPSICSTGGFLFLVNCGNSVSVFRRALPCCLALINSREESRFGFATATGNDNAISVGDGGTTSRFELGRLLAFPEPTAGFFCSVMALVLTI